MDPDSTAGTSDCRPVSSDKNSSADDDYISKLLGFEDNFSTEVANSTDADRALSEDQLKINHNQVTPEGTSELKIMNGHSHMPKDESLEENREDVHQGGLDNGYNLIKKLNDLMQIKKEANDLRVKWELTEKERNDLQFRVDLLQAENHQFKHLKNLKDENSQKVNELQKDLASKLKAQLKLRNEIESCNLQISEKNDAIKKMKKDNKSLWNMVTRFARKLADADLLTPKEKNTVKKYGEENHIPVDTFDSEDQGEEKDQSSLVSKNGVPADIQENTHSIENGIRTAESDNCLPTPPKESEVKNDGFQFSRSSAPLPKPKFSTGANYFMKSCRDVIEDPHVSDDCLDVTVNELKELRRSLSASNDHFSPISPLPPTPPPSSNRFRHGLPRRDLKLDNPILAVPVRKSPGQTSKESKSQGLLSVNSSVPNSSRKLTFCHQQSEGFDAPIEQHTVPKFNTDTGPSNHHDATISSLSSSSLPPYRFSAKRCLDGSVKLNFHINNPISMTVDPNNWEVSCILGQHEVEASVTPLAVLPAVETANVQACGSFNNNLASSGKSGLVKNKISKTEPASPRELRTPILKSSEQSSFVSVGKQNVSKPNILNQDISLNTNSFENFSKETTFQKELPLNPPQISINGSKALDAFTNLHRNNANLQYLENHVDDNRSVVSSSCESPSPYKKKNEIYSKELASPTHNSTSTISDIKSRKLDKISNVSKVHTLSAPEVVCQREYDSTGSESELTDKSNLTKFNSSKCVPIKKRRRSNLMVSVESSNIVPARNKGRTLLSRAFGSTKNSLSTNANLEVKEIEQNTDEKKKSVIDQYENDVSGNLGKVEEQTKCNSFSGNDGSNCTKSNNFVEENENVGEQVETLYENFNGKKRISRVQSKKAKVSSAKLKNESVVKSPRKKAKNKVKVELKRMAALKSRAAEWAAQRMKSGLDEKEHRAEDEPLDPNFSTSTTALNSLETHDTENSVNTVLSKTGVHDKEKILGISNIKPKMMNNFSNDSVNIPVESCDKVENKEVPDEMNNDTQENVPFTHHATNRKNGEKLNINLPDSTACSISNNNKLKGLFHSLKVDVGQTDYQPLLSSNQCHISVSNGLPNSPETEQKISTNNSSDVDNLIKNKIAEIKTTGLFKLSSSIEKMMSKNDFDKSPEQERNNYHVITTSGSNPLLESPEASIKIKSPKSSPLQMSPKSPVKVKSPKSSPIKIKSPKSSPIKIKSPKSSPMKGKYSDESTTFAQSSSFNSFANISNSDVKVEFPEVSLPPLPSDPFGLSGAKNNSFSPAKPFVGEKSTESPQSPSLEGSVKLSFLNNLDLNKSTSLTENRNNIDKVNNVKTNLTSLFNQEEFADESFIDFLVKDEDDTSIKTLSDTGTAEKFSNTGAPIDNSLGKTEMEESQISSISVGTISSAANSFGPVSNVDMVVDDLNKVGELKTTSPPVFCDIVSSEASSMDYTCNAYSNIDMIIDSVAVGGVEVEVETQDPLPRTCRKRQGPTMDNSQHAEKRRVKGHLKSIDLSIAKEFALSDGDTKHINGHISEADSDTGDLEIEPVTQDPSRFPRKKQDPVVNSSNYTEKRKVKGSVKSIDLNIANESAADTNQINSSISEADSDMESQLVIAEDIEEVQQSIPVSEIENSEDNVANLVGKITPNKTNKKQKNVTKTSKKIENKIELSPVEAAFQNIDKIRFSETNFRHQVHTLVNTLINPSVFESTPMLVLHLVQYLHTTRKNPMLSFSISNDPNTLLPISEQCIVKALLVADDKNKPHLSGLLTYAVESLCHLVLGKMQYHIYGLSSLCRVMTAICKELDDPSKPRQLCCDVLKYNHKFAPFLIASIVGVYREAFEVLPDTTEEEKIFLSALSYGVQQKPKTVTETQWKHCNNVFSKYLTVEFLTNVSETIPYLMSAIEDKCLSAPYEDEYLLMGPLVIYARVKGWPWALKHLIEDYILPNLNTYSNQENGERAFSFFTNLCADICYGCPDEELSRSCLMQYWRSSGEREFVPIHAGTALLKLILLRKELFPDEMQEWIPFYHEDPRVVESSNVYFKLRLMEDQELGLKNDIIV